MKNELKTILEYLKNLLMIILVAAFWAFVIWFFAGTSSDEDPGRDDPANTWQAN